MNPHGYELPPKGFSVEDAGYQAPAEDGSGVEVVVKAGFAALAIIESFSSLGRHRSQGLAFADQSKRKMYDRPYFNGGSVVKVPWSSR